MSAIFFTDGVIANSISSADGTVLEYHASSESRMVLESLWERGARMGLIVHLRGQPQEFVDQALNKSGLLMFSDPKLVIYSAGFTESASAEAMAKAGLPRPHSLRRRRLRRTGVRPEGRLRRGRPASVDGLRSHGRRRAGLRSGVATRR